MRNKMKKALSLILAMCIVATLVPAAFATGETAEVLSTKTITLDVNNFTLETYKDNPESVGNHKVFYNSSTSSSGYHVIKFGDVTASDYDQYETYFPSDANTCTNFYTVNQYYDVNSQNTQGVRFNLKSQTAVTLKTKAIQNLNLLIQELVNLLIGIEKKNLKTDYS